MAADRFEVRLSGSGGQGIITAGIILAEAAAVQEGRNVVQTQSYGPESRGGASRAEVVISDDEIDYPKVTRPNLVLLMTQDAVDAYLDDRTADAVAIVDSSMAKDIPHEPRVVPLPLTEIAREEAGRTIVANIVGLGALTALSDVVSRESMRKAVLARVPKGTEELNEKALAAGIAAAEEFAEASTSVRGRADSAA
ncbi:MAG: 2-oxoacid:acceptor oxidoreductase family protein [Armatimonadota bacterium]